MFLRDFCFRKSACDTCKSFATRYRGEPIINSLARRIKSSQFSGSLIQWLPDPFSRKIAYKEREADRESPFVSNPNDEQGYDRISI